MEALQSAASTLRLRPEFNIAEFSARDNRCHHDSISDEENRILEHFVEVYPIAWIEVNAAGTALMSFGVDSALLKINIEWKRGVGNRRFLYRATQQVVSKGKFDADDNSEGYDPIELSDFEFPIDYREGKFDADDNCESYDPFEFGDASFPIEYRTDESPFNAEDKY